MVKDTLPSYRFVQIMISYRTIILVHKRFKVNPRLAEDYNDILKDYETNDILEKVPDSGIPRETVHYLPHHPVVNEEKTTTKIRPVFDVSYSVNKPSLNDVLYSGPNLLAKVLDILIRFRTNYIALVADIKKAFLNIEIAEKDRDFLRFLWKENPTEAESKIIVYRFLRVVMGLKCSPFLLNGTIKYHLETYKLSLPEICRLLADDLYVDDLTTGTDSVNEGKNVYNHAVQIMKEGGLELCKWITNNPELPAYINENEISENLIDSNKNPKVLGME